MLSLIFIYVSLIASFGQCEVNENYTENSQEIYFNESNNLTKILVESNENSTEETLIEYNSFEEVEEKQNVKEIGINSLLKIFGMESLPRIMDESLLGSPPEFMIDLYNTITDSSGITIARYPYNAHIVRCYMEKNNSIHDYFFFNVSTTSLTPSESILEAELHIFRMPTPHDQLHPSLYMTPFYILSLYEVIDLNHLDIPDLHKLLGVNYVPALGSGWEVFNVKQSVNQWVKGKRPNLGFLLAATSLGGDRVPVRFSRRGESVDSKQPNLVLFTEDATLEPIIPFEIIKLKVVRPIIHSNSSSEKNQTSNALDENKNEETNSVPNSSLENPRFHHALLYKDSIRHPNSVSRFRNRRSKNQTETINNSFLGTNMNTTSCQKRDFLINFETIGWSSRIIRPKAYNAFFCDGLCRFPMVEEINTTNHATVQSIIHELKLSEVVGGPCCVPSKLLPISLLFYEDYDSVLLKQYVEMVAEFCGCY